MADCGFCSEKNASVDAFKIFLFKKNKQPYWGIEKMLLL